MKKACKNGSKITKNVPKCPLFDSIQHYSWMPKSEHPKSKLFRVRLYMVRISDIRSYSNGFIVRISDIIYKTPKTSEIQTLERTCSDFRQSKSVRNPNILVQISDIFKIRTLLQPNRSDLSKIRTSSDFSIPLYSNLKNVLVSYTKRIGWPVSTLFGYRIAKRIPNIFKWYFNQIIFPSLHWYDT